MREWNHFFFLVNWANSNSCRLKQPNEYANRNSKQFIIRLVLKTWASVMFSISFASALIHLVSLVLFLILLRLIGLSNECNMLLEPIKCFSERERERTEKKERTKRKQQTREKAEREPREKKPKEKPEREMRKREFKSKLMFDRPNEC